MGGREQAARASIRSLLQLYELIRRGDAQGLQRHLQTSSTDINVVLPCKGIGVLHLAVGVEPVSSSVECTEVILKHGADPNLCSEDGMTPVHIAAIWGRLDNLRLLVACGGDPTRRDDEGLTAYDYATQEQQWAVCDYLKHRDDCGDDDDAQCTYSLQLDRVIVSTGHIVAEYGTVSEDQLKNVSVCRKSEMVREWCEQASQAVNRLYPTILNQTYMIQDESVPWKPGDFTNDFTTNTTTKNANKEQIKSPDETKTSYMSCYSKKCSVEELGISGIQVLEITKSEEDPNCDCSCHETHSKPEVCSNRVSVYENFSLPGSPNIITHKNYKSRTNLRLTKNSKSKGSSSSKETGGNSIMTSDRSSDNLVTITDNEFHYVNYKSLNDALVNVQNETNEWLSHSSINDSDEHLTTDVIIQVDNIEHNNRISSETNDNSLTATKNNNRSSTENNDISLTGGKNDSRDNANLTTNTRRISVNRNNSSGVSLHSTSSGSIAIASVQEEYKYEDLDENVVLIEKRLIVPSVVLPVPAEDQENVSPEESRHSIASSLPASIDYDAERLRSELTACGFTPGPINSTTKRLYLKKLKNLKRNPIVVKTAPGRTYSVELERSLRNETWFNDLMPFVELEDKVKADFANPKNARLWREGTSKTSFTYLLLDPRMTSNLPVKAGAQDKHATWKTFVNSIFYVGKGKRSRPYSHLYQALTLWKRDFKTSNDKKVQHILNIWNDQVGVICLHIFQNIIPAEAYTYEASMIDVLGLQNLKNLKCGNYYGVAAAWPLRDRRNLGLYLLYKAMLIFLSEGERQLRPGDID